MKDFFKNQTKPQFKRSIFYEGMRQLKIPGIVFTVICAVAAILSSGFDHNSGWFQKQYILTNTVDLYLDEIVFYTAFWSAVFVFGAMLYISHFMRSGKARDFYCSTPNSVGTIWLNFSASVYAWTMIGIDAAYLIRTVFMLIGDVKTFASCVQAFAGNAAFALMILGIMMLAITLSGRIINVLITAVGIALVPSVVWGTFYASYSYYYAQFDFVRYPEGLYFCDPLAIFAQAIGLLDTYSGFYFSEVFELFGSAKTILFCLIMGVIYIALSLLFASVRTGDTAGRPFINKAAHLFSFLLIITPIYCSAAGLSTAFLEVRVWNYEMFDYIFTFALIVLALIAIIWVCELVLTFDVKHSHRAYKYLPIPVVIALAITGAGYLYSTVQFKTTIDVDNVESFSLVRNYNLDESLAIFRLNSTYGRTVTEDSSFKDPQVIKYVASYINDYVKLYEENHKKAYRQSAQIEEEEESGSDASSVISIQLNLKDGRKIIRAVKFDKKHIEQMEAAIKGDKEYMEKFLALPDQEKLNIKFDLEGLSEDEAVDMYNCFIEEYNAMSEEQKFRYIKKTLYSDYNDAYDFYYDSLGFTYDEAAEVVGEIESNLLDEHTEYDKVQTQSQSKYQPVSGSDIKPVSKSCELGDYYIDGCNIDTDTLNGTHDFLDGTHDFHLQIQGYGEGHLYQSNYFFDQDMLIDKATFPKTHAFIVKTCNSKIPEIVDSITNNKDSFDSLSLSADYYAAKGNVFVSYNLATKKDLKYAQYAASQYWNEYYYDEYYGEERPLNVKTVAVDSNAMVQKLLDDAVATGDSVDFSKPYCRLCIWGFIDGKEIVREVFIQTNFEFIP